MPPRAAGRASVPPRSAGGPRRRRPPPRLRRRRRRRRPWRRRPRPRRLRRPAQPAAGRVRAGGVGRARPQPHADHEQRERESGQETERDRQDLVEDPVGVLHLVGHERHRDGQHGQAGEPAPHAAQRPERHPLVPGCAQRRLGQQPPADHAGEQPDGRAHEHMAPLVEPVPLLEPRRARIAHELERAVGQAEQPVGDERARGGAEDPHHRDAPARHGGRPLGRSRRPRPAVTCAAAERGAREQQADPPADRRAGEDQRTDALQRALGGVARLQRAGADQPRPRVDDGAQQRARDRARHGRHAKPVDEPGHVLVDLTRQRQQLPAPGDRARQQDAADHRREREHEQRSHDVDPGPALAEDVVDRERIRSLARAEDQERQQREGSAAGESDRAHEPERLADLPLAGLAPGGEPGRMGHAENGRAYGRAHHAPR